MDTFFDIIFSFPKFIEALGQVMLYVDGMHGVIQHNQTIQWLCLLTQSNVSDHHIYKILINHIAL